MRKAGWFLAAVLPVLAAGAAAAKGKVNDFPTVARADFVINCMSANGMTPENLHKCACAADVVAQRLTYQQYAEAQTILGFQQGHMQHAEVFRSQDISKEPLDRLFRARAAAELKCF